MAERRYCGWCDGCAPAVTQRSTPMPCENCDRLSAALAAIDKALDITNTGRAFAHASPPEATAIEVIGILQRDITAAREALWNACPHDGKYGDDGEMQCGVTDFKRDPFEILAKHVHGAAREETEKAMTPNPSPAAQVVHWERTGAEGMAACYWSVTTNLTSDPEAVTCYRCRLSLHKTYPIAFAAPSRKDPHE